MVADERPAGKSGYFLPNKMGRAYLQCLEEVMGRSAVKMLLGRAGLRQRINNYPPGNLDLGWAFEEVSALCEALEAIHGTRAGQGVAIRAGRASLYSLWDDISAVSGMTDVALRVLPLTTKLRTGLRALAELYNKTSHQVCLVEETEDRFLFRVHRCPVCWGRRAGAPICRAQVGLLQETVHWISGQNMATEEVECIAQGQPSCCYAIDKHPLE